MKLKITNTEMKNQWTAVEDKSVAKKYFQVCEDAAHDDNKFNNFRTNQDYFIVEATNKLHGNINLNVLRRS